MRPGMVSFFPRSDRIKLAIGRFKLPEEDMTDWNYSVADTKLRGQLATLFQVSGNVADLLIREMAKAEIFADNVERVEQYGLGELRLTFVERDDVVEEFEEFLCGPFVEIVNSTLDATAEERD